MNGSQCSLKTGDLTFPQTVGDDDANTSSGWLQVSVAAYLLSRAEATLLQRCRYLPGKCWIPMTFRALARTCAHLHDSICFMHARVNFVMASHNKVSVLK